MIDIESVETRGDKIYVSVKIKEYCNRNYKKNISCDTSMVEQRLKEKRVRHGKCIEATHLTNRRKKTCQGTWVFEKPKNQKNPRPQSRKSKKRQKTLDKNLEDVIMNSEEVLSFEE